MKAIIVDDEPRAIELLRSYLQYFPEVEVAGTFRNAVKALDFLHGNPVDLVFLDIQMPHLSGLSLSKAIDPSVRVIFTTAYAEYAVESYEVEALDYLLKPISLARFTRAMARVLSPAAPAQEAIPVKSGARIYRLRPQEILYLEKDGNYMTYYLPDRKVLARESIAEALGKLPSSFVQTHKSFIINLDQIDFYDKEKISVKGRIVPVGSGFREEFLKVAGGR